jgi:hypothetical protein
MGTLHHVCKTIGVTYEDRMLDTSNAGLHVNRTNEPWKKKVSEAADPTRIAVWKRELSPKENLIAEALLGDNLESFGYERVYELVQRAAVYPERFDDEEAILHLASHGFRVWSKDAGEAANISAFIGDPDSHGWIYGRKIQRIQCVLRIAYKLIDAQRLRRPTVWLTRNSKTKSRSRCAAMVSRLLNICAERLEMDTGGFPDNVSRSLLGLALGHLHCSNDGD